MLKKILVAFDGSEQSYKAFEFALEISKLGNGMAAEIFVLSVARPVGVIDSTSEHYQELFKDLKKKAKKKGLEIKTHVAIGRYPATQIIGIANEIKCDMMIVGHRGKSKTDGMFLGSVSNRVSRCVPCTVTIMK